MLDKIESQCSYSDIEKCRYTSIPRHNRICTICSIGSIEHEQHFLLICSSYRPLSEDFFQKIKNLDRNVSIPLCFKNNIYVYSLLNSKNDITVKLLLDLCFICDKHCFNWNDKPIAIASIHKCSRLHVKLNVQIYVYLLAMSIHFGCVSATKIVSEYDQEYHNHKLQTNPRHHEEVPHNNQNHYHCHCHFSYRTSSAKCFYCVGWIYYSL